MDILYTPPVFLYVATLTGLFLGSFYTVCVHRFLTEKSIVFPGSHCPHCGHWLAWWENIPVLSYIMLLGACRSCRAPIPWRYPALELLSGLVALLLALVFGPTRFWLVYMVFGGIFLIASFIDLEIYILPDRLTYPAALLALLTPLVLPVLWTETVLGAAFGAGLFWALQQTYLRWRNIDALGTGDIKLMLSLGALTGITGLPFMILCSALSALLGAVVYMRRSSGQGLQTAIPFGPFLCLGAFITLLWGDILQHLL